MQRQEVALGKRKSVIYAEGNEVFLSNSFPTRGLRYSEMVDYLDDFMETALNTHNDLAALAR